MGCDIHLAVEHKVDGVWHQIYPPDDFERDEYSTDAYNKLALIIRERLEKDNVYRTDDSWDAYAIQRFKDRWYGERSYYTFSILANVRNGHGFAGVPTGAGFVPISMPKGLPDDMSTGLVNQQDDCGILGDHSHSWLTVKELLDYDWDQTTKCCGCIPLDLFKERIENNISTPPDSYSGDVWGSGIVVLEEDVALGFLKYNNFPKADKICVRVWWKVSYKTSAYTFYHKVLPALTKIDPEHPENVRIVFGFDS